MIMMKRFSFLVASLFCAFVSFAQTSNPQQYKYVFTVAKDGSGDYKYIQEAIDAMRVYPLAPITLYIKNGMYNEKIELPTSNTDVVFIGEDVEKTIIVLVFWIKFFYQISGNKTKMIFDRLENILSFHKDRRI